MKTNFIKKTVSFAVIVFTLLAISSKSYAQTKQYENRYFYLYVPGVYQDNKTAYISEPIYYSTYDQCGASYDAIAKARQAFSNYLKANYNAIFPYGTQHFITVEYKQHSTSTYLKTRQDASVRLDALEAEISDDNYKINHTNFSYSCE